MKLCLFLLPCSAGSYWKPLDLLHQHITQTQQRRLQNVGLITKAESERLKNVNMHHWGSAAYSAPIDENLLRELRQACTPSVRGIKVHQSVLLYLVLLITFSHAHSNNSAFDFNCLAAWMVISIYQALMLFKLTTEVSGNLWWASTDISVVWFTAPECLPEHFYFSDPQDHALGSKAYGGVSV